MWIYGQAGLGKSAIATSLCQKLDKCSLLAASFFCKRDDPDRCNAQRVLCSLIYGIASRNSTYATDLQKVLDEDPLLPSSPLQMQFDKLLIGILESHLFQSPCPLQIVVVDAVDECGPDQERQQLVEFLAHMSQLASWLKVVVTSRPDPDISSILQRIEIRALSTRNLYHYNASKDIELFTRQRLGESSRGGFLPEHSALEIAEAAGGLFIWAHTACEFVLEDDDPLDAFNDILGRTTSGEAYPLDDV
ncbi:Vegetative incompatibility protein HET-E-1 [Ceratobasidium sp. AG-Ba]|nr:Vegetative incompatibility protein HET-E-1 [Ceratobasidium sp. AG-Ba]